MICLVRLCILPTPAINISQMMLGCQLSGPQQGPNRVKSHGVARARARGPRTTSRKRTAHKPARKRKRNKSLQIAVFCGRGRARAPQGPKTRWEKKPRTAQHTSQPQQKQNNQNISPTRSIAFFDGIYGVLPSIAGMPGSKNEPCLCFFGTFSKQCFMG